MRNKFIIAGVISVITLILFAPIPQASAADIPVSVVETCNVQVIFRATVPESVEQGKSFTMTNISIQPSYSYGFTVSSSLFDMTAVNTSSTVYTQNFYSTNPTPTTGYSTYQGLYPNWSLNATGPVGSYVSVKLKRTVTVVQGYGTVTCNFTKTLANVLITAPAPPPSSSPSPSPSPSSSSSPSSPSPSSSSSPSSPSGGGGGGGSTSSPSKSSGSGSGTSKPGSNSSSSSGGSKSGSSTTDSSGLVRTNQAPSVVPLIVKVKDSAGKPAVGAEVTLNGSKRATTNSSGEVTFSNVLTGSHSILASYKGQKLSRSIYVDGIDVGTPFVMNLASASKPPDPVMITAGILSAVVISAVGAVIVINRRKANEKPLPIPAITLPGIIAGSVVQSPAGQSLATVPVIHAHGEPVAPAPSPAPWGPALATIKQPMPLPETPPLSAQIDNQPPVIQKFAPLSQTPANPIVHTAAAAPAQAIPAPSAIPVTPVVTTPATPPTAANEPSL